MKAAFLAKCVFVCAALALAAFYCTEFDPIESPVELTYGGQTYRTVTIGGKTWMAENLNYQTDNSLCYGDNSSNCATYGRLYTWEAAKSACSGLGEGWRLPSDAEWDALVTAVGSPAGTKLKSTFGWYNNGNGTDDYGFSALPGGDRWSGGFVNAGDYGYWWSATENDATVAWGRSMYYGSDYVFKSWYDKAYALSVRCLRGN